MLQGFATLSGGDTGAAAIRCTRALDDRFVVKLELPGEQGEPGTLHSARAARAHARGA